MNIPTWSSAYPIYYTSTVPYPYSHTASPYNACSMYPSSMSTSLNASSGYESASRDNSLNEPQPDSPTATMKIVPSNFVPPQTMDDDECLSDLANEDYGNDRKKRRVLSRPQRQEANRRERQRMEIINNAYEELRNALPFKKGRKRQKMSRMDTVDGAIRYIHTLLETLHGPTYNPDWSTS